MNPCTPPPSYIIYTHPRRYSAGARRLPPLCDRQGAHPLRYRARIQCVRVRGCECLSVWVSLRLRVSMMMICLPPQGTPPPNTAADMAQSTHSTQPALRPHRATPRIEDTPPHVCMCVFSFIYVPPPVSGARRLHRLNSIHIYLANFFFFL